MGVEQLRGRYTPAPLTGSVTWDPGTVANGGIATQTITVSGAALGDIVQVGFTDALNTGNTTQSAMLTGYVSATDTVCCVFYNCSGFGINLASGTLSVRVIKP